MRAPTISEVAKTAGVSVATVSRVVNGSPSVSHETQARVQEAIERLGYQPNVWGRSLRRGESRVVLIIVPNVSNPYYAPIIAGTEDRLHEDGYSGMLCITNAEAERRALYLEFLKDGRADGAILMEPARDDPHVTGMARHYHLVQCSEYCDNQAVSHVSVDNLAAAREVNFPLPRFSLYSLHPGDFLPDALLPQTKFLLILRNHVHKQMLFRYRLPEHLRHLHLQKLSPV